MIRQIFDWWTRSVGSFLGALTGAWRASVATISRLRAGKLEALGDTVFVSLSVALLFAGAVMRVLRTAPGDPRTVAAVASAAAVAWAAIRLATLVAMQPARRVGREKLLGGWAAGTVVWVIAVSPELTLVAWLLSAIVTLAVFLRLGVARRYALSAIAVAWGLQALVTTLSLAFAGGWAVMMSSRS